MIRTVCVAFIIIAGAAVSYGQSSTGGAVGECPANMVCISREAAVKALADAETVKAQAVQIAALNKAVDDYKNLLQTSKVEFAAVSGENTALRQEQVRANAIMDILIKNSRPKKIGLINLF